MRGSVVVVTGSSRGIGRELARACARAGARVVLNGRDAEAVAAAVEEIRAEGGDAIGIVADVALATGAHTLIAGALARFGRVDVLVNNAAATAATAPVWSLEADSLAAVLATNINGALYGAREVLAWAIPADATVRIVNVSSGVTSMPAPRSSVAYVTSKIGLEGLTRALAADCDGTAVTILALQLGAHRTELVRAVWPPASFEALPGPEGAVRALLLAIEAPAAQVHGRVLAGWRLERDATAETLLADPRVGLPVLDLSGVDRLALADTDERYPDPSYRQLREELAPRLRLPAECFVVGAGASDLIDRALGLFARPGETVIANSPSWGLFPHLASRHGLTWRRVPYAHEHRRADHALEVILERVDASVRIVYLVSPANPGGRAIDHEAFRAFFYALPPQVTVVVDEAYGDFITRGDALRASELVGRSERRIVVVRTFSKLYGLAGLRVGYAATTPDLAQLLARAAPPFAVSRASEVAAIAALRNDARTRRILDDQRGARLRLEQSLTARGVEWLESDAPFLYARIGQSKTFLDDGWEMLPIRASVIGRG